jgi:hypothetical protein
MGTKARRTIVLSTANIKEPRDVTEKAFHLYSIDLRHEDSVSAFVFLIDYFVGELFPEIGHRTTQELVRVFTRIQNCDWV